MELDHLITNLKKPEQSEKIFLAIEIGSETIKTATWTIKDGKTKIIHLGSVEEVNVSSEDELLEAIDISVTKAQENTASEPKEVIFSLPETWIKNNDIDNSKKRVLKNITTKLALKAIGFVVTIEAITHFLTNKQAGPINTVLLGLTETDVIVTLVENGQIQGTHTVGRSDDLGADVEEGIARFGAKDSLPSSMTLYDGHTDLESQKQILISYNWQEHLPFLHIPRIEHLEATQTIEAAIFSAGAEVIDSQQTKPNQALPTQTKETNSDAIPDMSAQFGFHSDQASISENTPDFLPEQDTDPDSITEESNFVVHQQNSSEDNASAPTILDTATPPQTKKTNLVASIASNRFLKKIKLGGLKNIATNKLALVGAVAGITTLLLLSISAYLLWQLPSADITIAIKPDELNTNINFTINPSISEISIDKMAISGKIQTVDVTDTKSSPVTGEKLVGERASGTITIYNRTNSTKTFSQGTKLTGPDNLAYSLSDDVTIASASTKENPDFSITTEPSSKTVQVSATSIGAKYNLGAGTEFKVANFDSTSFIAKASTDLTGGTSRQITAVSQQDLDALEESVVSGLKAKAAQQATQTGVGNAISAIPITKDDDQKLNLDFSAKVGEETNTLTLNAKLTLEIMTYKKSDLALLVEKQVRGDLSPDLKIMPDATTLTVTKSDYDTETEILSVTADAKAKAAPTIKVDDVKSNILGRYPALTETYFKSLPNYKSHDSVIKPTFMPSFLKTYPRKSSNINITIETVQ